MNAPESETNIPRARLALADAKLAAEEAANDAFTAQWRLRWVSLMTLLRTVAHILHEGEANNSPSAKNVINKWWKNLGESKPEPRIYWDFICENRNLILKQYEMRVAPKRPKLIKVAPDGPLLKASHDGGLLSVGPSGLVVQSGYFQGQGVKQLASTALSWWEEQLDKIDEQIGRS